MTSTTEPLYPQRTRSSPSTGELTNIEQACLTALVPDSGTDWLDEIIRKARRDRIAAKAMQGQASGCYTEWAYLAKDAVDVADALIAALDGEADDA